MTTNLEVCGDELAESGVSVGSHTSNGSRAKVLQRVPQAADLVSERVARERSARILREALNASSCSFESFGEACGVSREKVGTWARDEQSKPSLLHLMRAASKRPQVVAAIGRAIIQAAGDAHASRPFGDRVIDLVIQVGKLGESFRAAMADGVLSDDERKELRVWINRAEYVLEGMKRSLGDDAKDGR